MTDKSIIRSIYDDHKKKLDIMKENRSHSDEERWSGADIEHADESIQLLASVLGDIYRKILHEEANEIEKPMYLFHDPTDIFEQLHGRKFITLAGGLTIREDKSCVLTNSVTLNRVPTREEAKFILGILNLPNTPCYCGVNFADTQIDFADETTIK